MMTPNMIHIMRITKVQLLRKQQVNPIMAQRTILKIVMKINLVHLAQKKHVLQTYAPSAHRSFVKKELLQVDAHQCIGVLEWVYATHVVMLVIVVKRIAK